MIAISAPLGVALGLLALAVVLYAAGYVIRSIAFLLPPAGQFLATTAELRQPMATSVSLPPDYATGATSWPMRRDRGVAPPPVEMDTTSETSAALPVTVAGDRDLFDQQSMEMLAQAERRAAAGSKMSERPPGPRVEGEM